MVCTFRLDHRGWASLGVGVDASADVAAVEGRLAQAVDVIVACHTGIIQRGREARRGADDALLAEASLQMDSSLDVEETLRRVARIAVPAVADGALVHLLRSEGPEFVSATHVAVRQQRALEEIGRENLWLAALLAGRSEDEDTVFLSGPELDGSPFADTAEATAKPPKPPKPMVMVTARDRWRPKPTATPPSSASARSAPGAAWSAASPSSTSGPRPGCRAAPSSAAWPPGPPSPSTTPCSTSSAGTPSSPSRSTCFPTQLLRHRPVGPVRQLRGRRSHARRGRRLLRRRAPPDGSIALLIGDVCGRGAEAAALTGLARHTLRTLLEQGTDPGTALSRLNRALRQERASRFLTAVVATLAPQADGTALLTTCSAGHPSPLVLRSDGTVSEVLTGGLLLGVLDDVSYESHEERIGPDDTVVLFTDGLTESREAGGAFFESILPVRLAALRGFDAAHIAESLTQQAKAYRASGQDDIALLVARWTGVPPGADLLPHPLQLVKAAR
ncbi:hypothetical protein SMICM304S_00115 [Streptomyces microflavus]